MKILTKTLLCALGVIQMSVSALSAEVTPEYLKAQKNGAVTNVRIKIVDDEDSPIADATVNVLMGMLNNAQSHWIRGVTDTNGVFGLEGKTCGNEIIITISKNGYYDSNRTLCYVDMRARHSVKDGKWQPWGKEERIVLRKVRNPTKLIYPRDQCFDSDLNVTNENIGYDMEIGDWIHPFGKGMVADFYVMFLSDGGTPMTSKYSVLHISFPKPNGAAYIQNLQEQSEFKGVYEAETNRFADLSVSLENRRVDNSHYRRRQLGDKDILVIRSRCIVDEYGKIVSANYSSLNYFTFSTSYNSPGCCRLSYYFNPTPNDTNLEPKR